MARSYGKHLSICACRFGRLYLRCGRNASCCGATVRQRIEHRFAMGRYRLRTREEERLAPKKSNRPSVEILRVQFFFENHKHVADARTRCLAVCRAGCDPDVKAAGSEATGRRISGRLLSHFGPIVYEQPHATTARRRTARMKNSSGANKHGPALAWRGAGPHSMVIRAGDPD